MYKKIFCNLKKIYIVFKGNINSNMLLYCFDCAIENNLAFSIESKLEYV